MCKNFHEGTFYILLIHILSKLLFLYFPLSFFDSPRLRTGGNKQCRNTKERFCGWSKRSQGFSQASFLIVLPQTFTSVICVLGYKPI